MKSESQLQPRDELAFVYVLSAFFCYGASVGSYNADESQSCIAYHGHFESAVNYGGTTLDCPGVTHCQC